MWECINDCAVIIQYIGHRKEIITLTLYCAIRAIKSRNEYMTYIKTGSHICVHVQIVYST